jgi:hypothetical protein
MRYAAFSTAGSISFYGQHGQLLHNVRVRGKVEVHSEALYCIEWRQDGRKHENDEVDGRMAILQVELIN